MKTVVVLAGVDYPLGLPGPYWVRQELVQQAQTNQVLSFAAALGLSLKSWPPKCEAPDFAYNVLSYGQAVYAALMAAGVSGEEISRASTKAWVAVSKAHKAPVELASPEGKAEGQGS